MLLYKYDYDASYWLYRTQFCKFNIPYTEVHEINDEWLEWLKSDSYSNEKVNEFGEYLHSLIKGTKLKNEDKLFIKTGVFSGKFDFNNSCCLLMEGTATGKKVIRSVDKESLKLDIWPKDPTVYITKSQSKALKEARSVQQDSWRKMLKALTNPKKGYTNLDRLAQDLGITRERLDLMLGGEEISEETAEHITELFEEAKGHSTHNSVKVTHNSVKVTHRGYGNTKHIKLKF